MAELKSLQRIERTTQLFERLLNLANEDALTNERFTRELKAIVKYISNLQTSYETQFKQLQKLVQQVQKELKDENNTNFSTNLDRIEKRLASIKDGKDGEKGKDADESLVIEKATEKVTKEMQPLSEQIAQAFEFIEDLKTAISDIEELLEEKDELFSKKIDKAIGAIRIPSPVGWTRHQSISLSSGTTTYSLAQAPGHAGKAAIVRYEGQVLTEGTHYSISGTDITLTFDPNNGTTMDVTYWPM